MGDVFIEIVVKASEAAASGIESRDEIEEPIEEALASGLGEVTGGGGGSGLYIIDVEIADEARFDEALAALRNALQGLKVPPSTFIRRRTPPEGEFSIYG